MADPVALGNQYKSEFESTIEGLRNRGTAIQQQIQDQIAQGPAAIEPLKQELINSVQDQSDVATPAPKVMATFMWTTVLVFGASLGFFLGANIFGVFVRLLLGGFAIALAVLGGLPAYAYYNVKAKLESAASDTEIRMFLLAFATGTGVVLGGGLGYLYFPGEPIALLTPLTIALVFAYGAPALGAARTTLLGSSIGGAFVVTSIVGLVTGSLSVSFLLTALLYAGVAFLTLQFLFKHVSATDGSTHLYMLGYIVGYFYVKALTFYLFGQEEAPDAEPSQPPAKAK